MALLDLDAFGALLMATPLTSQSVWRVLLQAFNALTGVVRAHGLSSSHRNRKRTDINASEAIMRFHELLPTCKSVLGCKGYDGFFYLERVNGDCGLLALRLHYS